MGQEYAEHLTGPQTFQVLLSYGHWHHYLPVDDRDLSKMYQDESRELS